MTIQADTACDALLEPTANQPVIGRTFVRLTTIFSLIALFLMMVRVTLHASHRLTNSDTWFHLRLGHEFIGPWSLSDPGTLSMFATDSWLPTQWSTEILAAWFEDWLGLPGVAWLFGALFLAFLIAVFILCRREGDVLTAVLATGVSVIAAGSSLSARPQVVSLVLFAVTVAAWRAAARSAVPPWWLIPLTWLWATAHGLWTVGVLLGMVTCLGMVLDRKVGVSDALKFFATPTLSLVAACMTPLGPRILTTQFSVGERAALIGEWGPTSFRSLPAFVTAVMVAVVVILWSRCDRVSWTPLLQLLLAGGWILLASRMVPFGAILVAPIFVAAVSDLLPRRVEPVSSRRGERRAVGAGTLVCLVGLALAVPQTASTPGGVPQQFASRLEALPMGASVLVEDSTGAWIEYAFPGLSPSIDGMFDAYPVGYMHEYADFLDLKPGWTEFVRRSDADVAVLRVESPVATAVEGQLGWNVVQRDAEWVYLVAPSKART